MRNKNDFLLVKKEKNKGGTVLHSVSKVLNLSKFNLSNVELVVKSGI